MLEHCNPVRMIIIELEHWVGQFVTADFNGGSRQVFNKAVDRCSSKRSAMWEDIFDITCNVDDEGVGIHIGSPGHFSGVWASPAPRREAPRGRTTPRLPVNDWGKVLLACTCVTSHATYKKKAGRDGILTRSVSLIFAILTRSLKIAKGQGVFEQPVD